MRMARALHRRMMNGLRLIGRFIRRTSIDELAPADQCRDGRHEPSIAGLPVAHSDIVVCRCGVYRSAAPAEAKVCAMIGA